MPTCYKTAVSDMNLLTKRKGRLIVSSSYSNLISKFVKEIFSNFFPIDADRNHNNNFFGIQFMELAHILKK
jgi:hypothetical protein